MQRTVAADTSSLTLSLAGKFRPSKELSVLAGQANDKVQALFDGVRPVLRADLDVLDLPPIWEQLAGTPPTPQELSGRWYSSP